MLIMNVILNVILNVIVVSTDCVAFRIVVDWVAVVSLGSQSSWNDKKTLFMKNYDILFLHFIYDAT